jgi:hypothetical protein
LLQLKNYSEIEDFKSNVYFFKESILAAFSDQEKFAFGLCYQKAKISRNYFIE